MKIDILYLGGMTVGGMAFFGAVVHLIYPPATLIGGILGGTICLAYGLREELKGI